MIYRTLGRTDLRISPIGFGTYRASNEAEQHRDALEYALESGFNLIDSSANYMDGSSEMLIGSTLIKCENEGIVTRDEIILVTKGGYIQGQNYERAIEREQKYMPYDDLVKVSPGLWHCIHPEFLEEQITRSLERLQVDCIDVYLLHNPEYYFAFAKKQHKKLPEAREEFYARIEKAFRHLEYEIVQGRIRWYGISSNNFPTAADHDEHVSLERIFSIAESIGERHHFGVVQFPMNLFENHAATLPNAIDGTASLLSFAASKNLGVLVNRPLNSLKENQLIRLAEPAFYSEIREEDVASELQAFTHSEAMLQEALVSSIYAGDAHADMNALFGIGDFLSKNWKSLTSSQQFNELYAQHFHPRFMHLMQIVSDVDTVAAGSLDQESDADRLKALFHQYRSAFRRCIEIMAASLTLKSRSINLRLHGLLSQAWDGKYSEQLLSQKALLALLTTEGVHAVLLGMRRVEYVDDAHAALSLLQNESRTFDWNRWNTLSGGNF